jgi:solute carrier family 35 protein E3
LLQRFCRSLLSFHSLPSCHRLKLALLPICVGVGLATVTDMDLNLWGVIWAVAGIMSTSFYQIWVKSKQQDLGLDSYQLLFLQAPPSALLVFGLSAATEPWIGPGSLAEYPFDTENLSAIIGTALLSFCVNLSIFLVSVQGGQRSSRSASCSHCCALGCLCFLAC